MTLESDLSGLERDAATTGVGRRGLELGEHMQRGIVWLLVEHAWDTHHAIMGTGYDNVW